MAEHPVPRAPQTAKSSRPATGTTDEPPATPKQLQALAHSRGRICKVKNCTTCAPLREARRLKKAQRKADAQAQHHAKGQPCGRNSCEVAVCVAARNADAAAPVTGANDESVGGAGESLERQAKRHRAGLPCGSEHCANRACIDAFALERARRHRARRPCKSLECDLPICVAARSTT
jgi:hypothetical protein